MKNRKVGSTILAFILTASIALSSFTISMYMILIFLAILGTAIMIYSIKTWPKQELGSLTGLLNVAIFFGVVAISYIVYISGEVTNVVRVVNELIQQFFVSNFNASNPIGSPIYGTTVDSCHNYHSNTFLILNNYLFNIHIKES